MAVRAVSPAQVWGRSPLSRGSLPVEARGFPNLLAGWREWAPGTSPGATEILQLSSRSFYMG